ncbi:hypothetical protein MTO96_013022 [Rhipicephalus appendiculatus]
MRPSCCICMDTIQASSSSSSSDDNSVSATECGHVFHDVCLRRWLAASRSCPTCRKQLRGERIVKLFLDGADLLPDGCISNDGGPLRLLQRQLGVARSQLEEAAAAEKRQQEETYALRSNVRRIEGVARMYNSKYANMLRENGRLRTQLRDLREEVRDRRILRRENLALQNELHHRESSRRRKSKHYRRVHIIVPNACFQSFQWPPPGWADSSDDTPQSGPGPAPKRPRLVSRMTTLSEGTVDPEDNLKNAAFKSCRDKLSAIDVAY